MNHCLDGSILSIVSSHITRFPTFQMWTNVNLESITAASLRSVSTPMAVTCVPVSTASLVMEKTALVSLPSISKFIFAPYCLLEDSLLSLLGSFFS